MVVFSKQGCCPWCDLQGTLVPLEPRIKKDRQGIGSKEKITNPSSPEQARQKRPKVHICGNPQAGGYPDSLPEINFCILDSDHNRHFSCITAAVIGFSNSSP